MQGFMTNPRKIPLTDLFRTPDKHMVCVAPDGARLAWLEPWKHRLNVIVRDLATGSTQRLTHATERDIMDLHWAGRYHLIFARDRGGDENYSFSSINVQTGIETQLTPSEGVKCSLLDQLIEVDDHILLLMNWRDSALFDVYRANAATGELMMVAENPGDVATWIADHDGMIRVAVTVQGNRHSIIHRSTEQSAWQTVTEYDFRETLMPQCFTPDNRALYVVTNRGRDKSALFTMDLMTGGIGGLVYEHPSVDVSGIVYSRFRNRLVAATFVFERGELAILDPEYAALQGWIDETLLGRTNRITSASRNEGICVVFSASDRTMGAYHLLNVKEHRIDKLFEVSPWLHEEEMSPMHPVRFTARDGLTLHGYLSVPLGDNPARAWPLVILPHGGPWLRDIWCFNPEVQFLVNRSFAVLQVNFRGSTGYGRSFWVAGFGQWGLAMQDDISDAVGWAIDTGIADPDKIAIYGCSYGGYAALAGMTMAPELYACGISYCGVSNIFTWLESIPDYWRMLLDMLYEMIGDPERDRERLRATSPFFHINNVRAPLLIAHGVNDPRVRKMESDQIVAALREHGVHVKYILKDNEGHGFQNEENRFELYEAIEAFLTHYLHVPQ